MKTTKGFFVGFRMIDSDMKLKSSELLNMLVDTSGVQSESVGDGFCSSKEKWIVSSYSVRVLRKPTYGEDIFVTTWSRNYTPVEAFREFEIKDKNGNTMIYALADFIRYDPYERKLKRLSSELMSAYCSEPECTNFDSKKPEKYIEPDTFDGEAREIIDWKWLDLNRHMNNSYYVELSRYVLEKEYGVSLSDYSFDVLYKKEIPENTEVKIHFAKLSDTEYKTSIRSADGKILHAGIRWKR